MSTTTVHDPGSRPLTSDEGRVKVPVSVLNRTVELLGYDWKKGMALPGTGNERDPLTMVVMRTVGAYSRFRCGSVQTPNGNIKVKTRSQRAENDVEVRTLVDLLSDWLGYPLGSNSFTVMDKVATAWNAAMDEAGLA